MSIRRDHETQEEARQRQENTLLNYLLDVRARLDRDIPLYAPGTRSALMRAKRELADAWRAEQSAVESMRRMRQLKNGA